MKKTALILLLACLAMLADAQLNMTLLDQIDYASNTNDIWGWVDPDDGTEYALVGLVSGVSIVDVSDPQNVVEVQFIPGPNSTWRDLKTWGNYAYVTNENSGGVLVINLSGAPNNITWTNWQPNIPGLGTLNKCHNLYIDEFGYCYLAGCNLNSGGVLIADVFTTPGSPVYVGKAPAFYAHDAYARNHVLYASELYKGAITLYDVVDKQNISEIASQPTPYSFTHNAWLNDAGTVVFTTDEKANAPIAAYDISDPSNIVALDQFRPLATLGTNVIPHNVHVWNDWLIISYYTDGGIIADASRPENIIEVGNWDTFTGNSGFSGVWGAYPFLPSGTVLLTDIGNGLFVCGANYVRACWLEGKVTNAITGAPVAGTSVSIASSQVNAASSDLVGNYKTGQAIPGTFNVTFSATGYFPKTVPATLENGVLTILDVALEPLVINTFPAFSYSTPNSGCGPLAVTFNENTGIVATWLWTFENGNPATSTLQNPIVEYTVPGTHSVSLQVVTQGGNTYDLSLQDLISVAPYPTAAFDNSIVDTTVTFTNNSSDYTSLVWDFGDNNSSTDTNPVHNYSQPGTYTVTLTVTGDCGTEVATQAITIIPFAPLANFGADVVAGCAPLTVAFTDQSTNSPTSWAWSFPGGNPATASLQNPIVTYTNAGTYSIELTASNAGGSGLSLQADLITVGEAPSANFSTSVNGPTVQFANNTIGGITYHWDFGDGQTSDEPNPLHIYGSEGSYTVVLTADNACGTSTHSSIATISSFLPVAAFNSDITAGCAPLTVAFNDLSAGQPISWQWSFPGGNPAISNEQNPSVTYSSAGSYSISLLVENIWGNAQTAQADLIVVNSTPTAIFDYTVNGLSVSFTNNSSNAINYEWLFNDGTGAFSTGINPNYTFPSPGIYEVVLNASNECGTATFSIPVTIPAIVPTAAFIASTTQGCVPLVVQFTDLSSNIPTGWEWAFPGGSPASSTEQNPIVTYTTAGTFDVSLTSSNAGGTSTASQIGYVVVDDVPTAAFDFIVNGNTVSFNNTSQNASSYAWDFGDNAGTSNEASPIYTYSEVGNFEATLVATNDCGDVSLGQTINIIANATDDWSQFGHRLVAFPNPFGDELWVEYELQKHFSTASIVVSNILGEVVATLPLTATKDKMALKSKINGYGLFFLRLVVDGKQETIIKVLRN